MTGPSGSARDVRVLVIGAGPSGIATAIALREAGVHDYLVLEQGTDVGGTWRDNTYPGCGCDVPSAWYSYSFDPNPFWSRFYSRQPEILRYFRASARRHGVHQDIRFGVRVLRADWDDRTHRWTVRTTDGEYTASVLAAAPGPLQEPALPKVPGLDDFRGTVFHSARWDHEHDLSGRRVAVVGTGASAIQFVPEIAHRTSELHVFQRTAPWVLPKLDVPVPWLAQQLQLRVPLAERLLRGGVYAVHEAAGVAFRHERLMRQVQRAARLHLYAQVRDGELRAALTPDFTLGCKRILLSNDWYPALARRSTTLHPTGAAGFTERSVVGTDGRSVEVDTVILGTGFEVAEPPVARAVFDGSGHSLARRWARSGGTRAYLGTTVAGMPNLFLFLGPNIVPGHASVLATIEAQARYTADAVTSMATNGWSALEVRPEVEQGFNERVQRALEPTVYNAGGCASYYLDGGGRNIANWPWSVARLHREMRFRTEDYLARTPAHPRLQKVGS